MTTYTFDNIKKSIGKKVLLYDDTNGWKTNRDVTETDIAEIVNELYKEKYFPMYQTQYPEFYQQIAYTDSTIATGTADAGLTNSTLVATTSIFNNGMIGLYVYNETDDSTTKITSYTNATTVEVENSDISDWSGDTIYVIGQTFALGGEAADTYEIDRVEVKYNTTDSDYKVATNRLKNSAIQDGYERFSEHNPIYIIETVDVATEPTNAITIYPQFSKKVTNGVKIHYTEIPTTLSNVDDKPRLPVVLPLIYEGVASAYEMMQDLEKANYWMSRAEIQNRKSRSNYRPRKNLKLQNNRHVYNLFNRNY